MFFKNGDWVRIKDRKEVAFVVWEAHRPHLDQQTLSIHLLSKNRQINVSSEICESYEEILPEARQDFINAALDLRRFDWLKED